MKMLLIVAMLMGWGAGVWADEASLTNANIVSAGGGNSGYKSWSITDGNGKTWNAYAIKNQHSNATSSYHFLQIKKYASNTSYYIQVPEFGTKITSITMTVSSTQKALGEGGNSATLFFSNSNSTSAAGTGVASGTGASSVTIDCSNLNLNTGYITADGAVRIWDVKVSYSSSSICDAPTFSPAAGVYTSAQNVAISTETEDADIYYTTNGSAPTTNSSKYISPMSVSETTTIKAMAVKSGCENSAIESATYVILQHAGTEADPYTVADARAAIDAGEGMTGVYAKGIVSRIDQAYSTSNQNISFFFVDEEGDTEELEAYRCGGSEAANIMVGDVVVVSGNLTKYQTTYEFASGCTLVSRTASIKPYITVAPTTLEVDAEGITGTFSVDYFNFSDEFMANIVTCDADGNAATYDWVALGFDGNSTIQYDIEANNGAARTAYFKVHAVVDQETIFSQLITINQAEYVAPSYAELPFDFNGGRADIEETDGLSQEGLGTDYNATQNPTTKLKFDGSNDYLLLQFDERPGILSFDIKGNSFSNGSISTFKVQTSVDGQTYTDLATYTELDSSTKSKVFKNLSENVRYIKWVYSEKGATEGGNVALGNIKLAKYVAPQSLTVSPLSNVEIFVFDASDQNEPLLSTAGTVEIFQGTQVKISVSPAPGYELQSLTVNNDDIIDELDLSGAYTFEMPSSDVTITATAQEIQGEQYALFTGELVEGDYVIYYDGKAMNNVVNNDRLQYVEVSPNNNVIITDNSAIVWHIAPSGDYWTIYSEDAQAYAAGTGAKNKAQMLYDGTSDMVLWSVSGTETYEFVNKKNTANNVNANLRNNGNYGFACYATSTGGALSLYKKVESVEPETATIAINSACNDGTYYYGTYYIDKAYDMPEGLTGQAVSVDTDGTLVVEDAYTEGTTVPANTALLIKAATAGDYTITLLNEGGSASNVTNQLKGTLTADEVTVGEGEGLFYRLTMHEGAIGFWWGAENGGSFAPGANKAYLFVPTNGQSVRQGFDMGGDANGISDLLRSTDNAQRYYNLQGQRVMQPMKGLYIVNGKKMIKK